MHLFKLLITWLWSDGQLYTLCCPDTDTQSHIYDQTCTLLPVQFWKPRLDVTSDFTDSWQEGSSRGEHIQERRNKVQWEDTCRRWRRRGRRRRRKTKSTSSTLLTSEICSAGWSESGGELTRPIAGRSQTLCLFSGDEIKLLPALFFFFFSAAALFFFPL